MFNIIPKYRTVKSIKVLTDENGKVLLDNDNRALTVVSSQNKIYWLWWSWKWLW